VNLTILKNYALLGLAMPSFLQRAIAREAQHQQEVLQVMSLLPGKYRYEQVEAAINASGRYPSHVYELIAMNEPTLALELFYEALNGPGSS
jgi:hypothetical protein